MKILAFFLFTSFVLNAQFYDQFDCPVNVNGRELAYPFTGGFSNPQFSEFDLNNDGKLDLFIFDRQGNSSMVLLRNDSGSLHPFTLTKAFNRYLPLSLDNFCLLNDFNNDGVVDLFTSGVPIGLAGIMLFQGSKEDDKYDFRVRRMGRPDGWQNGLWNKLNDAQVYVAPTDLPAIIDVDFDGDLDILSFDSGGSYMVYNRNFQVELGLSQDTMDLRIDDFCFGKFEESGLSQTIALSDNPALCAFSPVPFSDPNDVLKSGGAHSGSTVTAIDSDEDQDIDLLLGDLLFNGLVYLNNGGTPNEDWMTSVDENFPSYNISVNMPIFLGSYNVDVDGDGLKDILAAPNSPGLIQDFESIWYYQNRGVGNNQFNFVQNDFIQDETIDFGSFTAPVFVDYNADGLMDILVGQGGSLTGKDLNMSLVLFENKGSKTIPYFELVDDDYLGFSEYITTSINPSPCVGDIDNDGDIDLIIGEWQGRLYFYENIAGPHLPLEFADPIYNYKEINVGTGARPQIVDFNGDGLMDLVIGEERTNGFEITETDEFVSGNINYFQNIGTSGNPEFNNDILLSPNFNALGRIKTSFATDNSVDGGASPFFFNLNGRLNVVVGSQIGRMVHYEFDSDDPRKQAILVNDFLGFLKEGESSAPSLYDIDNDGQLEVIIGNSRGGLTFYNTDIDALTSTKDITTLQNTYFSIIPNPATDKITIDTDSVLNIEIINIYNAQGQKFVCNKSGAQIDISNLIPGVYFINIIGLNFNLTEPFIKIQ